MIAIVDYDVGNLKNVRTALNTIGLEGVISRDPKRLNDAKAIILPGVGAFSDAMVKLNDYKLIETLDQNVKSGKYLLGICLGMQLLFDKSTEDGTFPGLSYLPGEIIRLPRNDLKVPHMGWNNLIKNNDSPLLKKIQKDDYVYFVHSYYAHPDDFNDVLAYADYGVKVPAIVQRENVIGMQFHPEKSANVGLQLLNNFKEIIK